MASNDQLTEMVYKSVIYYLRNDLSGYTGIWLASPDFDHGEKPDGTARGLPYVVLVHEGEETMPYEVGNRKIQRNADFELWVVCEDDARKWYRFTVARALRDGTGGRRRAQRRTLAW